MTKNAKTVAECFREMQVLRDRISEIAEGCEKEGRVRNEAEEREFADIQAKMQVLQMRALSATNDYKREVANPLQEAEKVLRENIAKKQQTEFRLYRDIMTVADVTSGGIVPLNIKDILEPLEEGFILDKVGLPMLTGLVGDYVWPVYEMVEATICGEAEALADTAIEFSQLNASYDRIGLAIPVSRESLNQTAGVLETIIKKVMPKAIRQLLNKVLFTPVTKLESATNLIGPFVDGNYSTSVTFAGDVPTATELNGMKATLLATGIIGDNLCWIMSKSMEAILEVTPINSDGIFKPIIENHQMFGLPVYTTNYMEGYIGLGDFAYEPMGLFGDISFIVDPYTKARYNSIDFVINANYGCKTLRPEAFALGTITSTATE